MCGSLYLKFVAFTDCDEFKNTRQCEDVAHCKGRRGTSGGTCSYFAKTFQEYLDLYLLAGDSKRWKIIIPTWVNLEYNILIEYQEVIIFSPKKQGFRFSSYVLNSD
jgi:hypothetical protein